MKSYREKYLRERRNAREKEKLVIRVASSYAARSRQVVVE